SNALLPILAEIPNQIDGKKVEVFHPPPKAICRIKSGATLLVSETHRVRGRESTFFIMSPMEVAVLGPVDRFAALVTEDDGAGDWTVNDHLKRHRKPLSKS